MTQTLLGSNKPFLDLGNGSGQRGFLLPQIGSTVGPIVEAYSGIQGQLSQSLAEMVVFDKPVTASVGVAIPGSSRLPDVWQEILENSRPGFSIIRDRALDQQTMRWLFRRNNTSNPKQLYSREPSTYYRRYKEFQSRYALLLAARDSDVWRSLPGFQKFATFETAERDLLKNWFKAGYKAEIESAMWRFNSAVPFAEWEKWAETNARFEANLIPYAEHIRLPITRLFPPPASWSTVSMWFRGTSRATDPSSEYRFQFARIQIVRPWMDLDALLSGRIRIAPPEKGALPVSDGAPATENAVPNGKLGAFIEELILVRDITKTGGQNSVPDGHPLGNFAYPDAINVLGYIVRTLPAIPAVPAGPVEAAAPARSLQGAAREF
ncbi:hypothetical protein IVB03_21930 [Bradyrhizobium sp. 168]|uniref:hypothetical protein n=1 Tax=unclassified Bradyrhizobium TaxID=2631580 RepID=UPI001FF9F268|nr:MULTISPECIES: hypothetical protein [unclassified Bradyrhizobium]MCK1582157.1 hypothetical protein [Bradyrhizobium sp. 168]UPK11626.1 hypothetical protein IVA93_36775 [Bradyrhizobium sp. 155]UPK19530.1 hypothetical protein IVA73_37020 [Bradyrhizobium sp. 131]